MAEGIVAEVEALVSDAEKYFPPKPGGLVQAHRERVAAAAARAAEAVNAAEPIEERAYRAVKTAPESPEVLKTTTVNVNPGETKILIGADPYRVRATLQLNTAGATCILAATEDEAGNANTGNGYGTGWPLLVGVPFPVGHRAAVYVANPGGSAFTVSVWSESYAATEPRR